MPTKNMTRIEYRALLKRVFKETFKKLVTGGRACINNGQKASGLFLL
jgi:hypothetical protein